MQFIIFLGYAFIQMPDFLVYLRQLCINWFEVVAVKISQMKARSIDRIEMEINP